ncbi:hypothetical protein LZC95_01180 [Pendulispora brunnea]|uniref:Uncharacterized protein n=1 Tax=Pendulispora brunnea TaxID=2905690 RepID=A0ABZ2KD78_9BACT
MAIMIRSPYHVARRASDDEVITAVRIQAAMVRTLLDEVERLVPPSGLQGLQRAATRQLPEELARLGARLVDLAAEMANGLRSDIAADAETVCAKPG